MEQDAPDISVTVARESAAPGFDRVHGLQPACEAEILDRLHHEPDVLLQRVDVFVETHDVRGILRELNITGTGDAHCLLGVGRHLLGV